MNANEETELRKLLTNLNAHGLGAGDATVGANLLAAMACAVADSAPPGSGFDIEGKSRSQIGVSVLVSGPRSANLVVDEVVIVAADIQNNLVAQIRRYVEREQEFAEQPWERRPPPPQNRNSGQDALECLFHSDPELALGDLTSVEAWTRVLSASPSSNATGVARLPKVFVTAARPRELEGQLKGLNQGHVLVHLGVTRVADFTEFGTVCTSLMDGHYTLGDGGETARGHIIINDHQQLLHEVARGKWEDTAWLGRFLFLVDGNAGPEAPGLADGQTPAIPNQITESFGKALRKVVAARLDTSGAKPVVYRAKADLWQAQLRWMEFLKTMESSLPGISGTANKLLATLYFGFSEILLAGEMRAQYSFAGLEAFARFLVRRMANARAAMMYSGETAKRERYKQKILTKLADNRLEARRIYRCISISAPLCEELLSELSSEGLVQRAEGSGQWERLKAPATANCNQHTPTLEV